MRLVPGGPLDLFVKVLVSLSFGSSLRLGVEFAQLADGLSRCSMLVNFLLWTNLRGYGSSTSVENYNPVWFFSDTDGLSVKPLSAGSTSISAAATSIFASGETFVSAVEWFLFVKGCENEIRFVGCSLTFMARLKSV